MSRSRRRPSPSRSKAAENLPSKAQEAKESTAKPDGEDSEDGFVELLQRLPEGTPPEVIHILAETASFAGPLPPPSLYRDYEGVLPGAADRIMTMAETEQKIRRADNSKILLNDTLKISGAIIVSLGMIGAAVFCAAIGQPVLAGILGTTGVVGATVREFMRGK